MLKGTPGDRVWRYRWRVRCLLIAPYGMSLDVLCSVLRGQQVDTVSTSELGAGIGLALRNLDAFDCAIAVLPAEEGDQPWLPAMYVEIGVAAGRGIPVLVLAEPPGSPSPALAGLSTVSASVENLEALRLHVPLFLRSVRTEQQTDHPRRSGLAALDIAAYRGRLRRLRESPSGEGALRFERLVADLLRDAQARVEERAQGGPDDGVDIAAFIPGEEGLLGTLLFQVKWGRLSPTVFREIQERLSLQVARSRGGLGVVIYDQVAVPAERMPPVPLVFALSIDDLLAELEGRPLHDLLVQARNRTVHGM